MYAPYKPQKKNDGIYGYMRSAVLTTSDPVRIVASSDKTDQNESMTVSECESLILKVVQEYKRRPHKITKRRALAMLDARNEAAKREGQPRFESVRDFLASRLLPPAAR